MNKINLYDPMFEGFLKEMSNKINLCIKQIQTNGFECGTVTEKINIKIIDAYEDYPVIEPIEEEEITQTYEYETPRFDMETVLNMQKKYQSKNMYYRPDNELKYDETEDNFYLSKIDKAQLNFLESQRDI